MSEKERSRKTITLAYRTDVVVILIPAWTRQEHSCDHRIVQNCLEKDCKEFKVLICPKTSEIRKLKSVCVSVSNRRWSHRYLFSHSCYRATYGRDKHLREEVSRSEAKRREEKHYPIIISAYWVKNICLFTMEIIITSRSVFWLPYMMLHDVIYG